MLHVCCAVHRTTKNCHFVTVLFGQSRLSLTTANLKLAKSWHPVMSQYLISRPNKVITTSAGDNTISCIQTANYTMHVCANGSVMITIYTLSIKALSNERTSGERTLYRPLYKGHHSGPLKVSLFVACFHTQRISKDRATWMSGKSDSTRICWIYGSKVSLV